MAIIKKCGGPINKNTADLIFSLKEEASTAEQQVETLTEEVQALSTTVSNAKVSVIFAVEDGRSVPEGQITVSQESQEDQTISFPLTTGQDPFSVLGSVSVVCGQPFSFTIDFQDSRVGAVEESIYEEITGDVDFQMVEFTGSEPTWATTINSNGRVSIYQI
jgi:hypothetical protein